MITDVRVSLVKADCLNFLRQQKMFRILSLLLSVKALGTLFLAVLVEVIMWL